MPSRISSSGNLIPSCFVRRPIKAHCVTVRPGSKGPRTPCQPWRPIKTSRPLRNGQHLPPRVIVTTAVGLDAVRGRRIDCVAENRRGVRLPTLNDDEGIKSGFESPTCTRPPVPIPAHGCPPVCVQRWASSHGSAEPTPHSLTASSSEQVREINLDVERLWASDWGPREEEGGGAWSAASVGEMCSPHAEI